MKLEKGLQDFLAICKKEKAICTVEGNISRPLTDEEANYINEELKEYAYRVNCFYCETCEKQSNGKSSFHIERVTLE